MNKIRTDRQTDRQHDREMDDSTDDNTLSASTVRGNDYTNGGMFGLEMLVLVYHIYDLVN